MVAEQHAIPPFLNSCPELAQVSSEITSKCTWDILTAHGNSDHLLVTSIPPKIWNNLLFITPYRWETKHADWLQYKSEK